jgi:ubiquitin carboxyl-terminal hydrolase L5
MSAGNWCLIESDPGVFTELIANFGVKNVQVEEVYSMDDMSHFQKVFGLIFLFKWQKTDNSTDKPFLDPKLFFANQVINNACATQAILSILLNSAELEVGNELKQFKEFTHEFDPQMKGLAISNSDTLRHVHNSFSRPENFIMDNKKQATEDDDVFHFVGYIPFNGHLVELDGLKEFPVDHGAFTGNWLDAVKPVIQNRIQTYSAKEIRFNLMAVVSDPKQLLEKQLSNAKNDAERNEIRSRLMYEEQKMAKIKKENARRRHNFIPFMLKLLELSQQQQ